MKTAYLSGPMTGREHYNFPAFDAAAARWSQEYFVLNPADRFGRRTDLPRSLYMRHDIAELLQCDTIIMLDGWQESHGARLEHQIAREIDLEIRFDQ